MIQNLSNAGVDTIGSSPADYNKALLDETERLAKTIAATGIKGE